jgi:hypothetical protein
MSPSSRRHAPPDGYGDADAELARDLRGARDAGEADRIAQADGHEDAEAARQWLTDRSRLEGN